MTGSDVDGLARPMWQLVEPLHALLYYAPEANEEAAALGYRTDLRWPSYFAWRAAPLGAAGAELVAATFYSFSPAMVAEYVPEVWRTTGPSQVLEARRRAVDRTYRAVFGDLVDGPEFAEAAALARRVAEAAATAGRPLAAANADLPWPDEPHMALWQAVTILREQRGDGHIAALLTAGLDPAESLVSFAAVGAAPVEVFASRGWTDEEWSAASERLAVRGWLDETGRATETGEEGRAAVERLTDELATPAWQALTDAERDRFAQLTVPLTRTAVGSGLLPARTTLGIGRRAPS